MQIMILCTLNMTEVQRKNTLFYVTDTEAEGIYPWQVLVDGPMLASKAGADMYGLSYNVRLYQ